MNLAKNPILALHPFLTHLHIVFLARFVCYTYFLPTLRNSGTAVSPSCSPYITTKLISNMSYFMLTYHTCIFISFAKCLLCMHIFFFFFKFFMNYLQSTIIISKLKEPSETLQDIRTSTYQICRIEENTEGTTKFHK